MTHKRKKCFARKSRFTIIELIVVMLIMSMMLVVALPAFTHLDKDYKQQQAVQEISGQIAIAKSYSMANQNGSSNPTGRSPHQWQKLFLRPAAAGSR